jgi:ferredoxin
MSETDQKGHTQAVFEAERLQTLVEILARKGYQVIGPTVRDKAIVYAELESARDLPVGWTDLQEGGTYRLEKRRDEALFGYVVGPHSWKQFLHPPKARLCQAKRKGECFESQCEDREGPKRAFLGVRACEMAAIAVQDRVLLQGTYTDPVYQARRGKVVLIAVNCTRAGGTCFCTSMGTGPKVTSGYDIALTEVLEDGKHYFVAQTGTELGEEIVREVPHQEAGEKEKQTAEGLVAKAAGEMGRTLEAEGVHDLLVANLEHKRWDEAARRCLTCGNCTLVCPTCFCTTVEDVTDLTGEQAERWRRWDSCFTLDFSYIHGGSVRPSGRARYRQWMTHKLATWHDQFGTSGCVGCGRCITWCPVGIDITEEARAIRESTVPVATQEGKEKSRANA